MSELRMTTHDGYMRQDADGIWWPKDDTECSRIVPRQVVDMDVALAFVPEDRRTCCVQAGGNVGLWPIRLAGLFERVYTFEPDAENWYCLCRNLSDARLIGRVLTEPAALGEVPGKASMLRDPRNVGAHRVVDGEEVEVIRLDDYIPDHEDVSYLQLDVEGYEWQALKGAEALLERCSPVLQLELKGIGKHYGYEDREVFGWLAERGYQERARVNRDVVFTR